MRPLMGLTLDTYSYMCMAYESCRRRSKNRASQSGLGTAPARGGPGGRRRIGSALQHFQAPGLPLSPNGTRDEGADAYRRCQDPVHSKAFAELGSAAPPVRHRNWADAQRDREPCLNKGPTSRAGAWLRAAPLETFAWSIGLIVCLKRSWHKSFRFWRQQSAGSLAQSPKQRRP
jgi:hypothetical protein